MTREQHEIERRRAYALFLCVGATQPRAGLSESLLADYDARFPAPEPQPVEREADEATVAQLDEALAVIANLVTGKLTLKQAGEWLDDNHFSHPVAVRVDPPRHVAIERIADMLPELADDVWRRSVRAHETQPAWMPQLLKEMGRHLVETWQKSTPTEPDWIDHTPGDPCPCEPGVRVKVRLRDGETGDGTASEYLWGKMTDRGAEVIQWKPAQ